ncbi:hypothetical protein FQA39_LY06822 [Lamprigera yunnana]|nr:hypothetical protein FQA39_LY06822 [Lamprigera yunnana]
MSCIFKHLKNSSKPSYLTRSRRKELKLLKKVVAITDTEEEFEHICKISINDRITLLGNNNRQAMDVGEFSSTFVLHRFLCMNGPTPTIQLHKESNNRSGTLRQTVNLKQTIHDRKSQDIQIIDITDADESDDVIIVPDTSSIVDQPTDLCSSYMALPVDGKLQQQENCTFENTANNSIIEINDTCDDIIFVGEETPYKELSLDLRKKMLNKNKRSLIVKNKQKNVHQASLSISRTKKRRSRRRVQFKKASVKYVSKAINAILKYRASKSSPTLGNAESNNNICTLPMNNVPKKQLTTKRASSRASLSFEDFENNICNVKKVVRKGLREIIIDGSNVAMGHSNGKYFSVEGLQIIIDYFRYKGHKVTAFVPQYRQKYKQSSNSRLLQELGNKGTVVFTPSRDINGMRITPYDDRYILQYATACEGIVVSSDQYRDLYFEKPAWQATIKERLLMPTWANGVLILPEDPLGRGGPNLKSFLRFPD